MFVGAFTMKNGPATPVTSLYIASRVFFIWQGVNCILCLLNRQQEMHKFKLCLMQEQI